MNTAFGGRLAFIGMVIFQIIVAIIPGEPLEIGAGYAFGAVEGTILCPDRCGAGRSYCGAAGTGATALSWWRSFSPKEKIMSLRFMQDSRRLELLVFIVFTIPGTPKDLLLRSRADQPADAGLAVISLVARIPSIITSTIGGNALGERNYVFAAAVFAVTLLISLGGISAVPAHLPEGK